MKPTLTNHISNYIYCISLHKVIHYRHYHLPLRRFLNRSFQVADAIHSPFTHPVSFINERMIRTHFSHARAPAPAHAHSLLTSIDANLTHLNRGGKNVCGLRITIIIFFSAVLTAHFNVNHSIGDKSLLEECDKQILFYLLRTLPNQIHYSFNRQTHTHNVIVMAHNAWTPN